jgi:serine/threonine protein kinase
MQLSITQTTFITHVESIDIFNNRYSNFTCVNAANGKKINGCFSFIFKAFDTLEGVDVAFKFYDPEQLGEQYRLQAFDRESSLLEVVKGKNRCLDLIQPSSRYLWSLEGQTVEVGIPYFITEWLDDDIEHFSLEQDNIEALSKLLVFRDIVLSVAVLHNVQISHRDIKLDNLRKKNYGSTESVVAIDYGTAAHLDTPSFTNHYSGQVGHGGYSAPEALSGLAGVRDIAYKTDIYAVGCILFELFNVDAFYILLSTNRAYGAMVVALKFELGINPKATDSEKKLAWNKAITPFLKSAQPPSIDQNGNTLPKAIIDIILKLHSNLVCFNYENRLSDVNVILTQLDSTIRILSNEKRQQKILEQKKELRDKRVLKLKRQEEKLLEHKNKIMRLPC